MSEEIALFIDFENIRYSMLNIQRREPDPQELITIARRYGVAMVARAYADWSRQPETFKGSLTAAMIDRVDCPAKQRQRFRPNQVTDNPTGPLSNTSNVWSTPERSNTSPLPSTNTFGDLSESYSPSPAFNSVPSWPHADAEIQEQSPADFTFTADKLPETEGSDDAPLLTGFSATALSLREKEFEPFAQSSFPGTIIDENDQTTARLPAINRNTTGHLPAINQGSSMIQSTVDLNMVMDMIETVFDRPSISTFILMTGNKDFTRICARLKLRLNKNVIIVGVPGTVSRDLISSASQFVPLFPTTNGQGFSDTLLGDGLDDEANTTTKLPAISNQMLYQNYTAPFATNQVVPPIEILDPQFIQFLDYIDRNWPWRTIASISNFLGDLYNPKNRFRGRFTRESAREFLYTCIQHQILLTQTDTTGVQELYLNRAHPDIAETLKSL